MQALWDLNAVKVKETLGGDVVRWQRMLTDITRTRATFDTALSSRQFGPVTIDFEQARVPLRAACPLSPRCCVPHLLSPVLHTCCER